MELNKFTYITFAKLSLVATLAFAAQTEFARAEEQTLAVANELIIDGDPLHKKIADKYTELATGRRDVEVSETTNSAIKLSIPLDPNLDEGEVIDDTKLDIACDKFHRYIRSLRKANAEARENNDKPQIVYNFNCSSNILVNAALVPNDSRKAELWAIEQSNNVDLDLSSAWDKSIGNSEVVVAIIDTGIDYYHTDLSANVWRNPLELTGVTGVDDDGNGVIDDVYGYNAMSGSSTPGNPYDDNSHGTHVAGTIGGVGNNSLGVVGANWNVKMMGVKFLNSQGSGQLFDSIKAIDYVTNMKIRGVNIVASNNSWGWVGGTFIPSIYDAIYRANNAGILFIAAAGNETTNVDSTPHYPSSFDVPNVISVGAIDRTGALASFSNYGVNGVDIVAPGVSILSTVPGNAYASYQGTSMATPQVTGVIALLKGYAPLMTMSELRDTLYTTSKQVAGAQGKTKYGTMPSAYNMLLEADRLGYGGIPLPPTVTPTVAPTLTATPTLTPTRTPTPTPTIAPGYFSYSGKITVKNLNNNEYSVLALAKVVIEGNGKRYVVYTDSQGRYKISNLYGPANYTVTISKPGLITTPIDVTLTGDITNNLALVRSQHKLRAIVENSLGHKLAGVTISDPVFGQLVTNSAGIVEFTVPWGSEYNLNAQYLNSDFLNTSLKGMIRGDVTRRFILLPY